MLTSDAHDLHGINFEEGYIAVVDKSLRWTSADVVRKVKFTLRKLGYRRIKVGHAGTLDPLATGILLVCIGRATKMADALQAEEKEYVADVMLGATTPSYDLEHEIDATYPWEHITREAVEEALRSLTGERLQEPPVYSAKKIEGTRAYELARAGEEVELRKARITIYEMELLECDLPDPDPRAVQQGDLHPFAGPRDRRGARQRRPPHLAAQDPQRRFHAGQCLGSGGFSQKSAKF